jgi:hypothetical protein
MESVMAKTPIQTPKEDLSHQPEFVLLSIARNQSASPEYRKAAVEHLIEKGYTREANHPDIDMLVAQVMRERAAKDEVQAIVESATEKPLEPVVQTGVTTATMYQSEQVGEPVVQEEKKSRFWRVE